MKKIFKITIWIIALAVYLNIGWAIGTYEYKHVRYTHNHQTLAQKFLAGPWKIFSKENDKLNTLKLRQISASIVWPLILIVVVASWIIYAIYLLLWLIFAGGIAKLIGMG